MDEGGETANLREDGRYHRTSALALTGCLDSSCLMAALSVSSRPLGRMILVTTNWSPFSPLRSMPRDLILSLAPLLVSGGIVSWTGPS